MSRLLVHDDDCSLCAAAVRFARDRIGVDDVRWIGASTEEGRALLEAAGLADGRVDSVVFVEDGRAWTESEAVWRLGRLLRGPWRLVAALRFLPRPLRDAAYRWVARRRHRPGGRCAIPTPPTGRKAR